MTSNEEVEVPHLDIFGLDHHATLRPWRGFQKYGEDSLFESFPKQRRPSPDGVVLAQTTFVVQMPKSISLQVFSERLHRFGHMLPSLRKSID